jgi:hypothetical protein
MRLTRSGKHVFAVPQARGRHLKPFTTFSLILNDLRKGTRDFYLTLRHGSPIMDHRHASACDIAAVILAYTVAGWFLLAQPVLALSLSAVALRGFFIVGVYLMSRAELLAAFWPQGIAFFIKAIFMMWCLDLVRGVCVGLGCLKLLQWKGHQSNMSPCKSRRHEP